MGLVIFRPFWRIAERAWYVPRVLALRGQGDQFALDRGDEHETAGKPARYTADFLETPILSPES